MKAILGRVLAAVFDFFSALVELVLVLGVRAYQIVLSPIMGGQCRFTPTCSHYFLQAVSKYGPWRGAWRGTLRILRCHPFHPGGFDPP